MSRAYVPELGQFAFGNPTGEYEIQEIGEAAIGHLLDEIERVYWNVYGKTISFDNEGDAEDWNGLGSGIEWHAYWWGGDDTEEALRPNLSTGLTRIRWYKHPGRGMSIEQAKTPDEWSAWLDSALRRVRATEARRLPHLHGRNPQTPGRS